MILKILSGGIYQIDTLQNIDLELLKFKRHSYHSCSEQPQINKKRV